MSASRQAVDDDNPYAEPRSEIVPPRQAFCKLLPSPKAGYRFVKRTVSVCLFGAAGTVAGVLVGAIVLQTAYHVMNTGPDPHGLDFVVFTLIGESGGGLLGAASGLVWGWARP